MFYRDLEIYRNFGGAVFAREEGQHIADALGETSHNLILQNHGILTCGKFVGQAAAYFIALERACQCQLLVESAAGGTATAQRRLERSLVGDEEAAYTKSTTGTPEKMYAQFMPEYELLREEIGDRFLR